MSRHFEDGFIWMEGNERTKISMIRTMMASHTGSFENAKPKKGPHYASCIMQHSHRH